MKKNTFNVFLENHVSNQIWTVQTRVTKGATVPSRHFDSSPLLLQPLAPSRVRVRFWRTMESEYTSKEQSSTDFTWTFVPSAMKSQIPRNTRAATPAPPFNKPDYVLTRLSCLIICQEKRVTRKIKALPSLHKVCSKSCMQPHRQLGSL